jgi:dethiobiotin synthetase
MRTSPLFVTGTDTGVGKTTVTRGLLRLGVTCGRNPMPLKLVETGCPRRADGSLESIDGLALARAARREAQLDVIAPLRFELPAAPHAAANAAGSPLERDRLLEHMSAARRIGELVVEGAGGLLVPFTTNHTFADLALEAHATLLVVARDALGTLNHTLLTVEAARTRGLPVVGVVLNAVGPETCPLAHRDTLLSRLRDVPVWGPLPWLPGASDDALAQALERIGCDWSAIESRWT